MGPGKIYLTKSSIQLNKLADMALAAESIQAKLTLIKEQVPSQGIFERNWLKKTDVNTQRFKKITKKHNNRVSTLGMKQEKRLESAQSSTFVRLKDSTHSGEKHLSGKA
eukprot:CAMPEP_0170550748 /NCGR_PEP_ID=MMETSP0211-20121228/8753_1 /TAXON_ID=311385 /ORGANISM="Pseudokeronopsis sp., Strain OXSARD2" /LENGTH=108 /DNA_ID=CAMNT_0010857453 /DNA_START=1665 /DNA_END=1988 /DNA_ORIENTATION=+